MKKAILAFAIILLGMNFTSCTAESLDDENLNPTSTVGDDHQVPADPEDEDDSDGHGGN